MPISESCTRSVRVGFEMYPSYRSMRSKQSSALPIPRDARPSNTHSRFVRDYLDPNHVPFLTLLLAEHRTLFSQIKARALAGFPSFGEIRILLPWRA